MIVVGMPFANLGSAELQERMKYVKRLQMQSKPSANTNGPVKDAAVELYENICMNAVNQTIGGSYVFRYQIFLLMRRV